MALNLNVGILGHVDSGKTSLAKALSEIASTAAFDKDPQSQSRGITLDLGFSSFCMTPPPHLREKLLADKLQYTLVDCPGHASLIRTIIGAAQIIDMILLIIDITKGIQTQTAECLVIGEIVCKRMIVVLNKVDLVPNDERDSFIQKAKKKIKAKLGSTIFKDSPVVAISASPNGNNQGLPDLLEKLAENSFIPERNESEPFLFAVDHCFSIKGQGTVFTGTVLKGCAKIDDIVEIPALALERKIKSIQMFKESTRSISQGSRAGVCVTQLDSKKFERGFICSPNSTKYIYCGIIAVNRIKYFKYSLNSKGKYHISIGYETVLGTIVLFTTKKSCDFSFEEEYEYLEGLDPESENTNETMKYYMLIEFNKPVLVTDDALVIGSKLDGITNSNTCRIAFSGYFLEYCKDKDYKSKFLPKLKIFKWKSRIGVVERMSDDKTAIVKNMFKKETRLDVFIGLEVKTSFDDIGRIDSSFGKSGKIKVCFENSLSETTMGGIDKKKTNSATGNNKVEVVLNFKKYIYDNKNIHQ